MQRNFAMGWTFIVFEPNAPLSAVGPHAEPGGVPEPHHHAHRQQRPEVGERHRVPGQRGARGASSRRGGWRPGPDELPGLAGMKRAEIVAAARARSARRTHQGRVAGLALDCAGVPVHCAKVLGVPLTDYTRYGRCRCRRRCAPRWTSAPAADPDRGDRPGRRGVDALRRRAAAPRASWATTCTAGLSLIHAYNGAGLNRVVEHRIDDQWKRRIVAAWRYRGLEE
jgi:hypothetical protein